jgi:glutamine synthetase
MSEARRLVAELDKIRSEVQSVEEERAKAIMYHDKVEGYLSAIREHVDALEMIVDDEMWPLPKYRELLFIR